MKLNNRVAIVSAAGRGIGKAIAMSLGSEGATVIVNSYGEDTTRGTVDAINDAGGTAIGMPGDITDPYRIMEVVNATINDYGQIDILVNNAGGSGGFAPVSELSDEAWQEAASWILHSAFWATRAALQDMQPRRWGRIINISSVEGKQANKENVAHYITFKHALNGFTKAVALENGAKGITSNAISPGAIETDLMKEAGPAAAESAGITYQQFKENYAQDAAIKRLNTVDEVAGLLLFLCSDMGAGITGAILPVDGGTAL